MCCTMQYYLITKWFGTFLLDDKDHIVNKSIFPSDKKELFNRIETIQNNLVLDEEKKLAQDYNPFVAEKRLQSIGMYQLDHPFFDTVNLTSESYGFSFDVLHDVLVKLSKKEVDTSLSSADYQVIQQVNALDELQHIANVLSERIAAWNMYISNEDNQKPIMNVLQQVEKNQEKLKAQIEKDMADIAPNITLLIGPMLAARLLSHAGSLRKLAMLPSSSIQLLGAEKALFRFKKQGGKPPKHGVIFQHASIGKAPYRVRGKHARLLSAKLSIAAKADMFTKRFIAPDLKESLTEELKQS